MNAIDLMRGFSIRVRMLGAIAMVLLLLALVGGTGLYGMVRMQSLSDEFQQNNFKEVSTLSALRLTVGQMRRHEKQMLLDAGDASALKISTAAWSASVARVRELADQMMQGPEDEDNQVLREALPQLATYETALRGALPRLANDAAAAGALHGELASAMALADGMDGHMKRVDEVMGAEVASVMARGQNVGVQTRWMFGLALALAVLVVVPLTLLNSRSICAPIEQAMSLAASIAQGQLSNVVHDRGRDETGDLLRGLSQMQGSLRQLVSEVRQSAESISTASSEIASGNMDLSSRTESTSSSLQETASSMEQLTGNVQQSAHAATHANELAGQAAQAAQRGSSIMTQVVTNMTEIDQASRRINEIIGVIDGIAFQTNILALNAAVEAARAGEQGRGFAVVAGEVRSLAQRSAGAAREIKGLISSSSEKVDSGTRLVNDAGTAMQDILRSVEHVSNVVTEITTAASEQSMGIGQVNQAVTDLDQMTQQNAALVEQSAAAASSLKEQAQRLSHSVAAFQV